MRRKITYSTASGRETIRLGRSLGPLLAGGDVVAVTGPLGSGKTWLAKGVGAGLGIPEQTVITSPSFALVNEYRARLTFYHMDLYRLEGLEEVLSAGLEEYLRGDGIALVEWADRCPEMIPSWAVHVSIVISDPDRRRITLSAGHPRSVEILEALA
ncbi:MAG: tRNA (adenosine(37)-N6)-threonylcarbamoyltransferase complex ATPase subunit type 1 TsaE [Thermodesulfobacteriota bacterium]